MAISLLVQLSVHRLTPTPYGREQTDTQVHGEAQLPTTRSSVVDVEMCHPDPPSGRDLWLQLLGMLWRVALSCQALQGLPWL